MIISIGNFSTIQSILGSTRSLPDWLYRNPHKHVLIASKAVSSADIFTRTPLGLIEMKLGDLWGTFPALLVPLGPHHISFAIVP